MKTYRFISIVAGVGLIFTTFVCNMAAQPAKPLFATELSYYMPLEWKYTLNEAIPTPKEAFGFQLGEQHAEWAQIVDYMYLLASRSPRIKVKEYGRTFEQRPFICVTISSEKNLANIEALKKAHASLADPDASPDIQSLPAVTCLMNSIHGNEASGVNASAGFAYFFAAAQGSEIDELLDKVVINLIPGQNPDGITRFATWANGAKSRPDVSDPMSREYNEPWPGGRSNHYWHDMNRDWLPVQMPEMKCLMQIYHEWMPNTVGDFHEMGSSSTFFLEPSDPVCYYPFIPDENKKLTAEVSDYNMKALDRIGSLYLSKDMFDSYYLGTGDVYGDALGSIAMLFEQATSRGNVQKTDNGLLTFPFTIRNQITCAYGTVKASYELRNKLNDFMRRFCLDRYKEAGTLTEKAYLFDGNGSEAVSFHFIELLHSHGLKVFKTTKNITLDGHEYLKDKAYIVPVQQRNSVILRSLFESTKNFTDSLFYDVSTWNMVEAFNLHCTALKSSFKDLAGEEVVKPVFKSGEVKGGISDYAYLFDNKEYYSWLLVKSLQEAGLMVKVSGRGATSADGAVSFGPGMFVLPVTNQKLSAKEIYDKLTQLAVETGVNVQSVSSGKMTDYDLGHSDTQTLKEPKIALMAGSGFSTGETGSIWLLLNNRFQMKPTLLEMSSLGRANLNEYNVIIMPSGRGATLSEPVKNKLGEWVRSGGTLIATGSSWRVINDLKLCELKEKKLHRPDSALYVPYNQRADRSAMYDIPGSHLKVRIDVTHPIAWGYTQTVLPVVKTGTLAFTMPKEVNLVPAVYDNNPQLSGFLRKEHSKELENTPAVICGRSGGGHFVYFVDDLTFRSYWFGGVRMFMNAVFFGQVIR